MSGTSGASTLSGAWSAWRRCGSRWRAPPTACAPRRRGGSSSCCGSSATSPHARELAVDELRQRVVQEGHLLAAISRLRRGRRAAQGRARAAAADGRVGLARAPRAPRPQEAARALAGAPRAGVVLAAALLRAHLHGWHDRRASKLVRATSRRARPSRRASKRARSSPRRRSSGEGAQGETSAPRRRSPSPRRGSAARARTGRPPRRRRRRRAAAAAAADGGGGGRRGGARGNRTATGALEQAKQLEALWFEQREALLAEPRRCAASSSCTVRRPRRRARQLARARRS